MYLGNGWFTHASTVKHEVIYSNLFKSKYYQNKLRVCRRYLPEKNRQILQSKASNIWGKVPTTTKKSTLKKAILINAPRTQLEQTSMQGNYYLQVGSFIGKPDVLLVRRIRSKHLAYRVIQYKQDQSLVSKLLIGPFKTRQKALNILQNVREEIEADAFIAEIR
jgi:cell division septation protein DedD